MRDLVGLGERLIADTVGVRRDAERSLERARGLAEDGDPRTSIAVSACRDALGAYRDAVDESVRELCRQDAAGGAPTAPEQPGGGGGGPPARRVRSRTRERIAGALAVAGVAGILGLAAWSGVASWPASTSPSADEPDAVATTAPSPGGAGGSGSPAGLDPPRDEPRTARAAHSGGVRRVIVSTLPASEQADDGRPAGSTPSDPAAAGDGSPARPTPSSAGRGADDASTGPVAERAEDQPAEDAAGRSSPAGGGAVGEAAERAAGRVDDVVDAVSGRVPAVGRRLDEALGATSQQLLSPGDGGAGDGGTGDGGQGDGADAPGSAAGEAQPGEPDGPAGRGDDRSADDGGLLDGGALGGAGGDDAGAE